MGGRLVLTYAAAQAADVATTAYAAERLGLPELNPIAASLPFLLVIALKAAAPLAMLATLRWYERKRPEKAPGARRGMTLAVILAWVIVAGNLAAIAGASA